MDRSTFRQFSTLSYISIRVGILIDVNNKTKAMKRYNNRDGKESGVSGYEINPDSIVVAFKRGDTYLYTYSSAGQRAIEEMKKHAEAQKGLSTYISRNKPPYEGRWFSDN
jgi:hypothetical protein